MESILENVNQFKQTVDTIMLIVGGLAICGALLYRLRGGWFSDLTGIKSTQLQRLIWSLPTAILMVIAFHAPWWSIPISTITIFASLALIGHGAHMIMDSYVFKNSTGTKTELLTSWWLPHLFGGIPDVTWRDERVMNYQLAGMGFIGFVRNLLAALPMFWLAELPFLVVLYALVGGAHGLWYWMGWRLSGDDDGFWTASRGGELFVGFNTWGTLAIFMVAQNG